MSLSPWKSWRNRKSQAADQKQAVLTEKRRRWRRLNLERLEDRLAPAAPLSYTIPTAGPHAVTLLLNGPDLQIVESANHANVLASQALASTTEVDVTGSSAHNDEFTINFATGDFFSSATFSGGITFSGNTGDADTLIVQGSGTSPASDTSANYAPSSSTAGSGSVNVTTPAADPITNINV